MDDLIKFFSNQIADHANECCHRCDGWREDIYEIANKALKATMLKERDQIAKMVEILGTKGDEVSLDHLQIARLIRERT